MKKIIGISILLLLANVPAFSQIDLSGSWTAKNASDILSNGPGPGPTPVDFLGLPLNEFGLVRALIHSPEQLSEPERICSFFSFTQLQLAPFDLEIENETEPRNGTTIAWKLGGWEDKAPNIIWMDGRSHPSANAPHEMDGFSTGVWEDDVLTIYTTHMRASILRRNGVPSSDLATMVTRIFRHGDILTVTSRIDDPTYLSEPYYLTRVFQLSAGPAAHSVGTPCIRADEGVREGAVPHFLPGKNPFLDEMTKLYNIPVEAELAGAETMYPEYRKKIKDKYVIPERCVQYCGGPRRNPRQDGRN